jgi:hypothetical protein
VLGCRQDHPRRGVRQFESMASPCVSTVDLPMLRTRDRRRTEVGSLDTRWRLGAARFCDREARTMLIPIRSEGNVQCSLRSLPRS